MDDVAGCGDLEWEDSEPGKSIFPSASETPGWIHETANVHGEGTVDRVNDGKLRESLHDEVTKTTS